MTPLRRECAWLLSLPALLLSAHALAGYRFDQPGSFLTDAAAMPAWANTLERHTRERRALTDCLADEQRCTRKLKSLNYVIEKGASLEPAKQLRLVNRYINKRRYRRDRRRAALPVSVGGRTELRNQWATLLEFMDLGGDCEDYATAKYFLLRELGFAANDMRIVVAYDRSIRAHHALLAVRRADGTSWLLDSDNTIRTSRRADYRFVYAINESGIWDHE